MRSYGKNNTKQNILLSYLINIAYMHDFVFWNVLHEFNKITYKREH